MWNRLTVGGACFYVPLNVMSPFIWFSVVLFVHFRCIYTDRCFHSPPPPLQQEMISVIVTNRSVAEMSEVRGKCDKCVSTGANSQMFPRIKITAHPASNCDVPKATFDTPTHTCSACHSSTLTLNLSQPGSLDRLSASRVSEVTCRVLLPSGPQ